jgi:alpha-galactosidase
MNDRKNEDLIMSVRIKSKINKRNRAAILIVLIPALFLRSAGLSLSQENASPPDEPAQVKIDGQTVSIVYNGRKIFEGRVENPTDLLRIRVTSHKSGKAVHQLVTFNAKDWEKPVVLSGLVSGSEESFPCESDRNPRGLPVVRHSSGLSRSQLNQAVYDRKWDWVLSVDDQPRTRTVVRPETAGEKANSFSLKTQGYEIILRFRPRFYQIHRGLRYFEPWNYQTWKKPVVGWCSWFVFFDKITEPDMLRTADVLAEVLAPFGYEYVQMDDGYQRGTGLPELWLEPNDKFPHGLEYLASYIRNKGLKPGIWTNVAFDQADFAATHKDWFVRDAEGNLAKGNWIRYPLDASVRAALDAVVRPIYRGLKADGFEYFKVDALRHLRYEGYNAFNEYFVGKRPSLVETYRKYVATIREEIGREYFMLGCWGVRPELVGLVDGCRLGTDGFSFAGLAQFNSFNNVVWRNDPDHIELSRTEAFRSTAVTSLTGSLMLLTDKPEVYRTEIVEPAKRSAPALFTLPGQIYDVDPSRSQQIGRVDAEVSGKEPKVFDAGLVPGCQLYLLEIERPFESWLALGRTGGDFEAIRFSDLGLDGGREYFVYEFWSKKLLGSFSQAFAPGPVNPEFNCQVFVIRERQPHPQVLATNRHITGGGVDLVDVRWEDGRLSGRSRVVGNDVYELYISVPTGFVFEGAKCEGAEVLKLDNRRGMVKISLHSNQSKEIAWFVSFSR